MSKYLIKPVSPYDLKQALNKVASELILNLPQLIKNDSNYRVGEDGLIYKDSKMINLSTGERNVLKLLLKNMGSAVEYSRIFYAGENNSGISNEASLRNVVAKLRKKCPDIDIKNVKDLGYVAMNIIEIK